MKKKVADIYVCKMKVKIHLKRLFDILVSGILIIFLLPLFLLIGVAIKLTSEGPVIFRQERAGECGRVFVLYKFRTMVEGAENALAGKYIAEDEKLLTSTGRYLRRWALDELPQLFNVLKGDMSLVGPRPALPYQVAKYDERQRKRLLMKPGITGWAQVNGRNKLNWPERIEYDIWYVENWSLWLDFKIMLLTIPTLIKKEYAFANNHKVDNIVKCD